MFGRWCRAIAVGAALLLATSCTRDGDVAAAPTGRAVGPSGGGTLRLAATYDVTSVALWDGTAVPDAGPDPQMSYGMTGWELLRCCLVRTLFAYPGLPGADGGAEARPDLASSVDISADALTWTITIRRGIRYAPPLDDVEVTAADFVRALLRSARADHDGRYVTTSFYYSVIEGFDRYASGRAETISGLETPDPHTLVIRLTQPASDLPDRLAMPAAAPIPPNPFRPEAALGVAQGHDEDYGRFLVASGPYVIAAADQLDFSRPPKEQEPAAGYDPPRLRSSRVVDPGSLVLVRNPSWDATTDDIRPAYADRMEIEILAPRRGQDVDGLVDDLGASVDAGEIDHVIDALPTREQVERFRSEPGFESRVWSGDGNFVYYLWMNVAVPPLDDVQIRRAIAHALDEESLVRLFAGRMWGVGPGRPEPHSHIVPDAMEGDALSAYDPYEADLGLAKADIKRSPYDRVGADGVCDAASCRSIVAVTFNGLPSGVTAYIVDRLARLGIRVRFDRLSIPDFVHRAYDERRRTAMSIVGWGSDHLSPSSFFTPVFASEALLGSGSNPTMLGASHRQLREWGYEVDRVPSIDDRIDRCMSMMAPEQPGCWIDLDRYLMEEIVPVVPILQWRFARVVSGRVDAFTFDQFTGMLALDRMAVAPGSGG